MATNVSAMTTARRERDGQPDQESSKRPMNPAPAEGQDQRDPADYGAAPADRRTMAGNSRCPGKTRPGQHPANDTPMNRRSRSRWWRSIARAPAAWAAIRPRQRRPEMTQRCRIISPASGSTRRRPRPVPVPATAPARTVADHPGPPRLRSFTPPSAATAAARPAMDLMPGQGAWNPAAASTCSACLGTARRRRRPGQMAVCLLLLTVAIGYSVEALSLAGITMPLTLEPAPFTSVTYTIPASTLPVSTWCQPSP